MRSVGTTVAGAVMAIVLTSRTITFGSTGIPTEGTFQLCVIIGAAAAILAAVLTLLISRGRRAARVDEVTVEQDELVTAP